MARPPMLSKGEVLMYLALSGSNRSRAAKLAGVSRKTFHKAMRTHRVRAPRPQAKLNSQGVARVRDIRSAGVSRAVAAKSVGVHPRTIQRIEYGETWFKRAG